MGDSPVSRPKLARRQTVTALHDNLAAVVGGQSTEVTRRLLLRNLTERLRGEAADLPEESTAQRRKFLRTLVAQAACEIDKAGSALDHADRECLPWLFINEQSTWMHWWRWTSVFMIFYSGVFETYQSTFNRAHRPAYEEPGAGQQVANVAISVFFWADILFRFFTVGNDEHDEDRSRLVIARTYVLHRPFWFWIDAGGCFPWMLILQGRSALCISLLGKFLRVCRAIEVLYGLSKSSTWPASFFTFVQGAVISYFLIHFLTLYLVVIGEVVTEYGRYGGEYGGDLSMFEAFGLSNASDPMLNQDQYITGLYWAITTITTIGYGDIVPKQPGLEMLFVMMAEMIGMVAFGVILNSINDFIGAMQKSKTEHITRIDNIRAHMGEHHVSVDLQTRVLSYINFMDHRSHKASVTSRGLSRAEEELLSDDLCRELRVVMNLPAVQGMECFRTQNTSTTPEDATPAFIRDLAFSMKHDTLAPTDILISEGNYGRDVIAVLEGEVCVYSSLCSSFMTGVGALSHTTRRDERILEGKADCTMLVRCHHEWERMDVMFKQSCIVVSSENKRIGIDWTNVMSVRIQRESSKLEGFVTIVNDSSFRISLKPLNREDNTALEQCYSVVSSCASGRPLQHTESARQQRDMRLCAMSQGEILVQKMCMAIYGISERAAVDAVRIVGIVGSTEFHNPASAAVCAAIGAALADLQGEYVIVTGGFTGAGRAIAKGFFDYNRKHHPKKHHRTFHLLPHTDPDMEKFAAHAPTVRDASGKVLFGDCDFGTTIHMGQSVQEREALMGVCKLLVSIEGGPGAANELRQAATHKRNIVPVFSSGGAASGMFQAPEVLKPPLISSETWAQLSDKSLYSNDPERVAAVVAECTHTVTCNKLGLSDATAILRHEELRKLQWIKSRKGSKTALASKESLEVDTAKNRVLTAIWSISHHDEFRMMGGVCTSMSDPLDLSTNTGVAPAQRTVWVGKISPMFASKQALREYFGRFGELDCMFLRNKTGSGSWALVTYMEVRGARAAFRARTMFFIEMAKKIEVKVFSKRLWGHIEVRATEYTEVVSWDTNQLRLIMSHDKESKRIRNGLKSRGPELNWVWTHNAHSESITAGSDSLTTDKRLQQVQKRMQAFEAYTSHNFEELSNQMTSIAHAVQDLTHAVRSTRPDTQLPASASTAASASTVSSNTAVATKPDTTGRLRRITYYGEPPAPHLDAQQSVSQLVTERGKRGSKAPLRRRSSRTQTQESLQPVVTDRQATVVDRAYDPGNTSSDEDPSDIDLEPPPHPAARRSTSPPPMKQRPVTPPKKLARHASQP